MKLRLRLALATLGVAAPMVVGLMWMDGRARHQAAAALLIEMTRHGLDRPGERERCEADPAAWERGPGPRPGDDRRRGPPPGMPKVRPAIRIAVDASLASDDPRVPRLSGVRETLAERDAVTLPAVWWDDQVEVVMRTPWQEGPCAYVYVRGETTRGFIGAILPSGWIWLLPVGAVMAAVLIAVGPVVRRVRRLTDAVERSAAAGFDLPIPVDGRDEIAELARAFGGAGRAVRAQLGATEDRERALRDFLSNTTHDVMIPLSVLLSHLATLQERERAGEPHDPKILTAAMDEAHYLGALMHNLSAAARIHGATPTVARGPVDLNALLARVIGRHRPIAERLGIEIDHAVPAETVATVGDVTLIEQAVSNLVYNAIRHNRPGGHTAAILEQRDGDGFHLRVIDDGPGIPPAELSRLVERGFRGDDARTRSPDGQGIGLDITLRVAELHGFTLRFAASEYGGLQVDLEGRPA
jgi:signal transduction histidine kinase